MTPPRPRGTSGSNRRPGSTASMIKPSRERSARRCDCGARHAGVRFVSELNQRRQRHGRHDHDRDGGQRLDDAGAHDAASQLMHEHRGHGEAEHSDQRSELAVRPR